MASTILPGRLGHPEMSLSTDPRVHPKLLKALETYGLHETSYLTPDMAPGAPLDTIRSFALQNEEAIERLYNSLDYSLPEEKSSSNPLTITQRLIPGPDGNDIKLIIYRPATSDNATKLPAVLYFHGGGMIILSTENPMHTSWAESLARTGLVVIIVDFRNAVSRGGASNPFPAGLKDCATAVQWVDKHRDELRISKLVLQGESGGANLAFSTTLLAKREGWLGAIDGVCGFVPYISGAYDLPLEWKLRELPSLVECDGYLISCTTSALNAQLYDMGENTRNPLTWPYWATEDDLRELPPHLIVTNELDPLRDEGNAYYKKLVKAGVRAVGKVNLGVIHSGDLFLRQTLPDLFQANLWELNRFAYRL